MEGYGLTEKQENPIARCILYITGGIVLDHQYMALSKMLFLNSAFVFYLFDFFTLFYCMTMFMCVKHFESALCMKSAI